MTVLFDIEGKTQSSQNFATFDPAAFGANLALAASNTTLKQIVNTAAPTSMSFALCTVGSNTYTTVSGAIVAEFYIYCPGGFTGASSVRLGLATVAANINGALGGDINGYGLNILPGGTGPYRVFHNGGVVASRSGSPKFGYYAVVYDQTAATLTFYTPNTSPIVVTGIPAGNWMPAAGINANVSAGNNPLVIALNSGLRPWDYYRSSVAYPPAGSHGWWAPRVSVGTFKLADRGYVSQPTDTPANTVWRDRLTADASLAVPRALQFAPWGGGSSAQSASLSLVVDNGDGELDVLAMGDSRDANVLVRTVEPGAALSTAVDFASLVVDNAVPRDDISINLTLRDNLVQYENVLPVRVFPPDAQSSVANKPFLYTLGIARSVGPLLFNTPQLLNVVADDVRAGVAVLRDMGYALIQGATPPDFTQSGGVIALARNPVGVLTADIDSINCALAANGAFASSSTDNGAGYEASHAVNGDRTGATGYWQDGTATVFPDTLQVAFSQRQTINKVVVYSVQDSGGTVEPDDVLQFTQLGVTDFDVLTSNDNGATWTTQASITGNALVKRTVTFAAVAAQMVQIVVNATAASDGYSRIVEVEAFTQPPGTTLDSFQSEIFTRANLPVAAGAAAIDTAAGYVGGIGIHAAEPIKVRDAIEQALLSFHACMWQAADGTRNMTRLIAPESVSSGSYAFNITPDDMLGGSDLIMVPDNAPALSTQAMGQRNYVSLNNFSTDVSMTADLKAQLAADYRITRTYNGNLANRYASARFAPAFRTLIDNGDDLQSFIDFICGIYQVPRAFPKVRLRWLPGLELGQVGNLVYTRYGLAIGVPALVKELVPDPVTKSILATFWIKSDD